MLLVSSSEGDCTLGNQRYRLPEGPLRTLKEFRGNDTAFVLKADLQLSQDREGILRKNSLLDFVQITSPPPQFGQLVQLFSDVKIQDLKVSLGQKIPKL